MIEHQLEGSFWVAGTIFILCVVMMGIFSIFWDPDDDMPIVVEWTVRVCFFTACSVVVAWLLFATFEGLRFWLAS